MHINIKGFFLKIHTFSCSVDIKPYHACVFFLPTDDGCPLAAALSCCLIMQSLTGLFCHPIKCIIHLHFTKQEAKRMGCHFPCVCVCVALGEDESWCQDEWSGLVASVCPWRPRFHIEACFCSQTKLQQQGDTFFSLLLNTSQHRGNKPTQHNVWKTSCLCVLTHNLQWYITDAMLCFTCYNPTCDFSFKTFYSEPLWSTSVIKKQRKRDVNATEKHERRRWFEMHFCWMLKRCEV